MEKSSKTIRNGVVAGLMVSVIIAVVKLEVLRNLFFRIAAWLWHKIVNIYDFFAAMVHVPVWLVTLIGIIFISILLKVVKQRSTANVLNDFTIDLYRQSQFYDMTWRWNYEGPGYQPHDFAAFCPFCDMQLIINRHDYEFPLVFYCDKCNKTVSSFERDFSDVKSFMTREIQRKLRTGEWKEEVKKILNAKKTKNHPDNNAL